MPRLAFPSNKKGPQDAFFPPFQRTSANEIIFVIDDWNGLSGLPVSLYLSRMLRLLFRKQNAATNSTNPEAC